MSFNIRRSLEEFFWAVIFFIIGVNVYSMVRFWEPRNYPNSELIADIITATIGGIFGAIMLTLVHKYSFRKRYQRWSFGWVIIIEACISIIIIIAVFIPLTTVSGVMFFERTWAESLAYNLDYMKNLPFAGLVIYLLLISTLFSFLKQVSRKFGRGIMMGMLLGRYRKPREDNRIVMFLDLKSSTQLAEKLGHIRYSKLIQDCFFDLNSVLVPFEANIYKYVGDEVIISWSIDSGIRNGHCLEIFFGFHTQLENRREWYESQYGVLPEFKAGLNVGMITVAEVGEDRREIEYHGDVLNTASRIEEQCSTFKKEILISQKLAELCKDTPGYLLEEIVDIDLKGKNEKVRIFSVEKS